MRCVSTKITSRQHVSEVRLTARKIMRAGEEGEGVRLYLFTLFIRIRVHILCLAHDIHAKFHSKFMCFDRNQARVLFACKAITAAATIEWISRHSTVGFCGQLFFALLIFSLSLSQSIHLCLNVFNAYLYHQIILLAALFRALCAFLFWTWYLLKYLLYLYTVLQNQLITADFKRFCECNHTGQYTHQVELCECGMS